MHEQLKAVIPHQEHCPAVADGRELHVFYMGEEPRGVSHGFAWCPVCGALALGKSEAGKQDLHPIVSAGVHTAKPDGVNGCPWVMRQLLESIANGRTLPENPLVSLAVEWITDELEARKIANEVTLWHYAELHTKWKEAAAMADAARKATEAEREKRMEAEGKLFTCEILKGAREGYIVVLTQKLEEHKGMLRDIGLRLNAYFEAFNLSTMDRGRRDALKETRGRLEEGAAMVRGLLGKL